MAQGRPLAAMEANFRPTGLADSPPVQIASRAKEFDGKRFKNFSRDLHFVN
jgi:hypothetical protein